MSWLSEAIKKIRGDHNPPITIGTVVGGLARPIGQGVTDVLGQVAHGTSVGAAVSNTAHNALDDAADAAGRAIDAAQAGIQVAGATRSVLEGPVPWLMLGLLGASLLSRRGK